jgi:hypothetical protein
MTVRTATTATAVAAAAETTATTTTTVTVNRHNLHRYLGLRGSGVVEEWRKLFNYQLNDLCYSQNIVRPIKSIKMMGVGRVGLWGEDKIIREFLWGNLKGRDTFEDLHEVRKYYCTVCLEVGLEDVDCIYLV